MTKVTLDPRLEADTYLLGYFDSTAVLMLRNAHYPWLVLVPDTDEIEFHRLPANQQAELMAQSTRLASFIEDWRPVDKMNIAAIGNVVSQMHLHVVGRHKSDPSWPGVVWGAQPFKAYEAAEVVEVQRHLALALGDDFELRIVAAEQ